MTEEPKQDAGISEVTEQEDNRWGELMEFFRDNPTLVLSLLYLFATGIGMVYSAALYGNFGINVFDYSEITDFLLVVFKKPESIPFAVYGLATLVFGGAVWLGQFRSSALNNIWIRTAVILTSLLMFLSSFLSQVVFANVAAHSIKEGATPALDVRYRSFSGSAGQIKEPNLRLIGATQKAVFFYDVDAKPKRTIVIPQSQIVSTEVPDQD